MRPRLRAKPKPKSTFTAIHLLSHHRLLDLRSSSSARTPWSATTCGSAPSLPDLLCCSGAKNLPPLSFPARSTQQAAVQESIRWRNTIPTQTHGASRRAVVKVRMQESSSSESLTFAALGAFSQNRRRSQWNSEIQNFFFHSP